MPVLIYARLSRDEDKSDSIFNQIALCRDFVEKGNLGGIVGEYFDDNVSGTAFKREGLDKIKECVEAGFSGVVVVKDLSRLGRSNAKTLLLIDWFEERGVRIITVDGKYDSHRDNEMLGIETWYNEKYVRDISNKTRYAIKQLQLSGDYGAPKCYGYRKADNGKILIVNPREAMVVQMIFQMFIAGNTKTEIVNYLNDSKLSPPKNMPNSKWYVATISNILNNQTYLGRTVLAKNNKHSYRNNKIEKNPPEKWIVHHNTHQPIIEEEVFIKAQELIKKYHSKSLSKNRLNRIIESKMVCGYCGEKMYRNRGGYICSCYSRYGKQMCNRNFVKVEDILNLVSLFVEMNETRVDESVKYDNGGMQNDCLRQLNIAYRDYLDGVISKSVYQSIANEIKNVKCVEKDYNELKSAYKENYNTTKINSIIIFKNVLIIN